MPASSRLERGPAVPGGAYGSPRLLRAALLITLLLSALTPASTSAQTLFSEDFDGLPGPTSSGSGTYAFPAGWTLVNGDGRTPAGQVAYVNEAWERREDFKFNVADSAAFSTSWYSPVGAADDWMITPLIGPLPAYSRLTWNAIAYDPDFRDGYEVRISTTGATVAGCQANPALVTVAAENASWTARSVALDDYTGQSVRFCFHNNSNDQFLLLIDDVVAEVFINHDAQIVTAELPSAYTQIPLRQARPLVLAARVRNNGRQPMTNVTLEATIRVNGSTVYENTSTPIPSLASGVSVDLTVPAYTPVQTGSHQVELQVVAAEADEVPFNDAVVQTQVISGAVFARDDGNRVGTVSIGNGQEGHLGQTFELARPGNLSSVTVTFEALPEMVGQALRVDIFDVAGAGAAGRLGAGGVQPFPTPHPEAFSALFAARPPLEAPSAATRRSAPAGGAMARMRAPGDPPTALLGSTAPVAIPAAGNQTLTLPIAGGPLALEAGDFYLGVVDPGFGIAIGLTSNHFVEGVTWIDWPANPFGTWANNEDFGDSFRRVYMLRANFEPADQLLVTTTADGGAGSLRQVLADAPIDATVRFAPALSGQTIALTSAEIVLSRDVVLDATALPGGVTVSGGDAHRLFDVPAGVTATLRGLTLQGGAGDPGGAVRNAGVLVLDGVTVTDNHSAGAGGGLYNAGALRLQNTTVSANTAGTTGGGLANSGTAWVFASTLYGNGSGGEGHQFDNGAGGVARLASSVFGGAQPGGTQCASSGTITLNRYVFVQGAHTCGTVSGGTPVGFQSGNALLGPLAGNDGPTPTHLPQVGSPLIDAGTCDIEGDATVDFTVDQRAVARPVDRPEANADDGCDVGAVEGRDSELPVELSAFTAVADAADVVLAWRTEGETNNAGFEVEHASGAEEGAGRASAAGWRTLGFVEGHGTTEEAQAYTYRVGALPPGRHAFRLKQVDYDGAFSYSPEVEVSVDLAHAYRLTEPYPNPFRGSTTLSLTVRERQQVTVSVYDVVGRAVGLLHEGTLAAGETHRFTLDGLSLPSGLYVVRVVGETFTAARMVARVR